MSVHVCVCQALYKEDFQRSRGRGFSVVTDTPEMQRVKKTQDLISNVSPLNLLKLTLYSHLT